LSANSKQATALTGCYLAVSNTPADSVPTDPQKQLTFEDGVPVIPIDHWYWCFVSKSGGDLCGATKELCEQWMAKLGTGSGCVWAPQGVCFHTSKSRGGQPDFGLCFRTSAECKAMTEVWAADKTADPITMGCTILRSTKAVIGPAAPSPAPPSPPVYLPPPNTDHRSSAIRPAQQ
jgi:hypothetical protein